MKARFVGQPAQGQPNLLDFIEHVLDSDADRLDIVVAWAKRSGLGRVIPQLTDFRDRGGYVRMIVGVSEGGATREGLALAQHLADDAYVFHDPRRTFHPKVYLATGPQQHSLFVGSSNMTAGGLGWNYEGSLWLDGTGDLDGPFAEVESWIASLLAEPTACQPLTDELIQNMLRSSDIAIGSEDASRRVVRPKQDAPEDTDSVTSGTARGLFGPPETAMRPLPPLAPGLISKKPITPGKSSQTLEPAPTPVEPYVDTPLPEAWVIRRWFKQMDHTAAQRPRAANSNPTGNLRLSQEGFPLNNQTYFISDFFGGLPWTPNLDNLSEMEVNVTFDAYINGETLGPIDLRVSHNPNRTAGQNNVPTVLHWGSELGKLLRKTNYIDYYVTLERIVPDQFRIIIAPMPSGDFAA
ncbi:MULTISPECIES: phospholipase D family protein [unclassified Rathayibacter]|uniref:phospholipase D family protein n=1 Tax=unclassified Rathayibacter TaxID=2609250 RepID=UPI000AD0294F|nr:MULTISPECIES: phospholipase D family protein [unclassified Rathayibacter]